MNTIRFFAFFIICLFALFTEARADEINPRKGFTFTLQIPGFGVSDHTDQDDGAAFSFAGAFRFGFGLNEQVILFIESNSSIGAIFTNRLASKGVALASWNFGVQYFPTEEYGFFLTPKAGLGFAAVFNDDMAFNNARDGAGFFGGLGAGYEWRFGKSFALSPEARFDYYNISGAHAYFGGLTLNLQWY